MSHLGYSRDIICQLDCGATCNVIGYLQYARLVENGDPPITPTTPNSSCMEVARIYILWVPYISIVKYVIAPGSSILLTLLKPRC